ncbi:transmembrane protease serine 5 [Mixophyes fleayi]|uniref:transmembrane protease serine 5 n=1 Tax=Mixophyes fleayi TaxID=3061075 RepID=UPI003F4DC30B
MLQKVKERLQPNQTIFPFWLMHHKAVNLTNIKLNHSQEFVQIPLGQTTAPEHVWKTRQGCLSGRIVALKCSECGSRSKSSRIIGGSDVALGRWPWQVSLSLNNRHVCGGSIVAHQWIITAAHCVHNYRSPQLSSWSVLSGIVSHSPMRQKASAVEKIIYHQKYDDRTHDYDIALMKLEKPLNYSDSIRPVCLPQYDQDLPAGSECWISGWGHTQPDNTHMPRSLKEAMVPLISTKKCNSSCIYNGDITPRMLCAGYLDGKVDACQGDSGGPLVCQTDYTWRLVGVVSWGMGCAEPNRPGVYTKIASFLDWIHGIIEHSLLAAAYCTQHIGLKLCRMVPPRCGACEESAEDSTYPNSDPAQPKAMCEKRCQGVSTNGRWDDHFQVAVLSEGNGRKPEGELENRETGGAGKEVQKQRLLMKS